MPEEAIVFPKCSIELGSSKEKTLRVRKTDFSQMKQPLGDANHSIFDFSDEGNHPSSKLSVTLNMSPHKAMIPTTRQEEEDPLERIKVLESENMNLR